MRRNPAESVRTGGGRERDGGGWWRMDGFILPPSYDYSYWEKNKRLPRDKQRIGERLELSSTCFL